MYVYIYDISSEQVYEDKCMKYVCIYKEDYVCIRVYI